MIMTYAKLLSPNSIDTNPPKTAVIDGKFVIGRLPASYLATIGYYPFEETSMPPAIDGFHYERSYAYDDENSPSKVIVVWTSVANPEVTPAPRSLSKRKLYRGLVEAGIWEQVKEYMEANGVWEDWMFATTLDEDDPLIVAAIQALEIDLQIPSETIQQLLAASVAS